MHDAAMSRRSASVTPCRDGGTLDFSGERHLFALAGVLGLTACDTAHSTQTGQVTAISPSSVYINPEDEEKEPYFSTCPIQLW